MKPGEADHTCDPNPNPNGSYQGIMKPGEADHTCDQVRLGFSSGVHISIVVVAPCFNIPSQLFLASEVSTLNAAPP